VVPRTLILERVWRDILGAADETDGLAAEVAGGPDDFAASARSVRH
jgi:hypothetical protein